MRLFPSLPVWNLHQFAAWAEQQPEAMRQEGLLYLLGSDPQTYIKFIEQHYPQYCTDDFIKSAIILNAHIVEYVHHFPMDTQDYHDLVLYALNYGNGIVDPKKLPPDFLNDRTIGYLIVKQNAFNIKHINSKI